MDDQIQWSPGVTLEAVEKQVVQRAYSFYRGNKTATANSLGIAIRTLDNKLEKYESESKAELERESNVRQQRTDFLARERGVNTPDNIDQPSEYAPDGGFRVESVKDSTEKHEVPVPQRKEVQGMLSKNAPSSGNQRRR